VISNEDVPWMAQVGVNRYAATAVQLAVCVRHVPGG
jgi:hypothetical protein